MASTTLATAMIFAGRPIYDLTTVDLSSLQVIEAAPAHVTRKHVMKSEVLAKRNSKHAGFEDVTILGRVRAKHQCPANCRRLGERHRLGEWAHGSH